jgi:hypothetical protein
MNYIIFEVGVNAGIRYRVVNLLSPKTFYSLTYVHALDIGQGNLGSGIRKGTEMKVFSLEHENETNILSYLRLWLRLLIEEQGTW